MKVSNGSFPEFLKSARTTCALTQDDVCKKFPDLTPEKLARYEDGIEAIPPVDVLRLLAFYEMSLLCYAADPSRHR